VAFSPGVKRQGHEADRSPSSNALVMNGGAVLPLSCLSSWCGVELFKYKEDLPCIVYSAGKIASHIKMYLQGA
jgi:hypothetical protein